MIEGELEEDAHSITIQVYIWSPVKSDEHIKRITSDSEGTHRVTMVGAIPNVVFKLSSMNSLLTVELLIISPIARAEIMFALCGMSSPKTDAGELDNHSVYLNKIYH